MEVGLRNSRSLRGLTLLVVGLLFAASGWAQESSEEAEASPSPEQIERARQIYLNGKSLYDEGSYEEAIVAWEESYRLSRRPDLLFNIASAQERLGLYQEALDTLSMYKVYATADEQDILERRVRSLEARLAEGQQDVAMEVPEVVPPPSSKKSWSSAQTAGVSLVSAGVVITGLGIGFGLDGRSAKGIIEEQCPLIDGRYYCTSEYQPTLQRIDRDNAIFVTGVAVGTTAIVAGVVTLAVTARKSQAPKITFAPTWSGGDEVGVLTWGRF